MKLLVEELTGDPQSQEFKFTSRHIIQTVRPWIFKNRNPAGSLTLNVYNGATLLGTKSITAAEVDLNSDATTTNCWHGQYSFTFDSPISLNKLTNYKFELITSGYTFNETNYWGWVKAQSEFQYIDKDYTPVDDIFEPFYMEIWNIRESK